MNTIDHWSLHLLTVHCAICTELCHPAVGEQHKLLDKLICLLLLLGIDSERFAIIIQNKFELGTLEAHSTRLETTGTHLLRHIVQHRNLLGIVAHACLNTSLRLGIGEAAVGENNRTTKPLIKHLALLIELKDSREAQLLLIGAERTQLVAQSLGQHRHGAIHQIDRRTTLLCLAVHHRVGTDIVGYIGDMDSHLPDAILQLLN